MNDDNWGNGQKNTNKTGNPIVFIIVAAFIILAAICLTFQVIIPSINMVNEIGLIKTILRVFGAIGTFIWFYVFIVIAERVYEKRGSYGLSIIIALLALFCMACSVFFLPE